MSDDWQPGDLALVIGVSEERDDGYFDGNDILRLGAVYTVERVVNWRGIVGLGIEVRSPHFTGLWHHAGFRKIRPHTPDAEDAETIRLLNGAPVREPV